MRRQKAMPKTIITKPIDAQNVPKQIPEEPREGEEGWISVRKPLDQEDRWHKT